MRWGGEEFLLAVVGLDEEQAAGLAERLRHVVSATPCAVGADQTLAITVSGGCAAGPVPTFPIVVAAADAGLYEAKRTGRNRIVMSPALP